MANAYEPYLIGNMRYGLEEGLAPWLLPQDAWSTLKNAYLRRGVLSKRNGYAEFTRMAHSVSETIADTRVWNAITTTWAALATEWCYASGTLSNLPIRPGSLSFTDGVQTVDDDGDGTLSGDGTGTIDYTTGVFTVIFNAGLASSVTASYYYYPGYSIVGIENYSNLTTTESELMIFDKRRCAKWNETTQLLEDISSSNTWTGSDYDYIWGCNAKNILYVTNNVDRVKYWDGTGPWTNLLMDIDGDGLNNVDTCLFIIFYKERLLAFRPSEDNILYPQRVRWCKPEDHADWSNDGYVDCPTNDWIIAADFIGEDLIVWFENSCWRLKYTGDSTLPYRWEQISVTQGAYATFGGFCYNDVMGAIGSTNITETDNLKVYDIDQKIPDAVTSMNLGEFAKIYTIQIQELQQIIISYTPSGDTENSESLCYNYDDKAWSRYDYGFNVYGYYKEDTEPTLDDMDGTWDSYEVAWDDNTRQAGYPLTLGGSSDGYIYKINYGGDDNGSAIAFEAYSGRWNPYLKQGKRARFGWIEFLVDRDPDITMTVEFYAHVDGKEVLVESQDVIFGDATDETASTLWVRADNGAIGDFHRVKLTNNAASETIKIHATRAYFKQAGNMR